MDINKFINTIIEGDTIKNLKRLPDESIDFIFADPPYYMQTEGELLRVDGTKFKGVEDKWDKFKDFKDYDDFTKKWLKECKRVLKKDATIAVIGSFQNIYRVGNIMQDLGYWILNDIIWKKTNPVPNFSGKRFCNSHETILWCSKNKKSKITFNYKTMKYLNNGKQEKSIWEISLCTGNERLKDKNGNKLHSSQKPEKLLYKLLISATKPKDIILDPFFGTGTTGAVAKEIGRNYIGIEKEKVYVEAAEKRIASKNYQRSLVTELTLEEKPPKVPVKKLLEAAPKGTYKGIIPVDFAGRSVDLEDFRALADEYNLWIIEDACHAPGGYFIDKANKKQYCGNGNFADLAIFSFHPVKHIAAGEGGMITTNDESLYKKLLMLRTHGITRDTALFTNSIAFAGGKEIYPSWYMEMQVLGYNYRITDFQAALGNSQLQRADEGLERRICML